jgi:hypothetical protein
MLELLLDHGYFDSELSTDSGSSFISLKIFTEAAVWKSSTR